MDVPVPQIMEEIVEIVAGELVCNFWAGGSTGGPHIEQIVDVPVALEQNVDVIKVILQEQCQRMRFFF